MRFPTLTRTQIFALAGIGMSLIPYAMRWPPLGPFYGLPLLVTAVGISRVPRNRMPWMAAFSLVIFTVVAFARRDLLAAGSDVLFYAIALALIVWLSSQRARAATRSKDWNRVTSRLKRQSEQLRFSDTQLMDAIRTQQDTEQAYLKSEAERQSLLEHLPVYVIQKNREGMFTFATQSFCRLLGRDLVDIIGKYDHELFPPETAEKFRRDDLTVMNTGTVFNDVEKNQLPDGRQSYMQIRKAPLRDKDGSISGIQGIFWDVTEEFTSRIELTKIESLAHALINAALDAVLIVDSRGQILKANPACERILGYHPEQLESHPLLDSIMHPAVMERSDLPAKTHANASHLEEPGTLQRLLKDATGQRIEVRLRRSDESLFDAEISAHPLKIDSSTGWAMFIRDITRRKQAEKELRSAKENAESASIAKSEFVANVSHELRTPLTGIIGLHELLQNTEVDDQQSEYLELARLSASNLLTLIDDLLDFSKIESHQLELEIAPFSIVECVEKAAISVAARAQLRGLDLLIDLAPDLPEMVCGDSQRIQQILLNMIGNAIKFTERGSVRIRASRSPVNDNRQSNDLIRIEVIDTGIGIENHQLEFIFEPFRQADSSTTRRYGGTGLGLAICRELVTLMKGTIDVSSVPGKGSSFSFDLPLPVDANETHSNGEPNKAGNVQEIVIALPDSMVREILEREITAAGFRIHVMPLADVIDRNPPHLFAAGNNTIVITDYREISNPTFRTPPVVVKWIFLIPLSHSRPRLQHNWLTYADIDWLACPWRRKELMECLEVRIKKRGDQSAITIEKANSTIESRFAEVLLVEDSPISQTVLTEMLRKLGHHVDSVGTGKDAIAKCATKMYDLVLMDIQMPEIDGLEATLQIRRSEQTTDRHQAIIALTAHAMPSDRLRCQEVGMDGFLVKPIAFDLLKQAIDTVLGVATSSGSTVLFATDRTLSKPTVTATRIEDSALPGPNLSKRPAEDLQRHEAPSEENSLLSNVEQLELILQKSPTSEELASMFSGNTSLLREVLSLLIRELPRLRKLFESSLENGNCAEARRAVHTLKSNVRYVGLHGIAEYAEQIERIARDGKLEQLQKESGMLSMVFDHVANWADMMLRRK